MKFRPTCRDSELNHGLIPATHTALAPPTRSAHHFCARLQETGFGLETSGLVEWMRWNNVALEHDHDVVQGEQTNGQS